MAHTGYSRDDRNFGKSRGDRILHILIDLFALRLVPHIGLRSL
ncbi:hypothetical protein [Leptolyngbya sp. NM2-A1]